MVVGWLTKTISENYFNRFLGWIFLIFCFDELHKIYFNRCIHWIGIYYNDWRSFHACCASPESVQSSIIRIVCTQLQQYLSPGWSNCFHHSKKHSITDQGWLEVSVIEFDLLQAFYSFLTCILGNPTLTMTSQLCVKVNEKEALTSHRKSPGTVLPSSRTWKSENLKFLL